MTTVAVIQPYFFPYAGYFRLFTAADTVVMFDCVQFPRRGWVHRNRFATANGELEWLTLPLEKAPRDVRIADLRFSPGAQGRIEAQLARFPQLERARRSHDALLERMLRIDGAAAARYLIERICDVTNALGIQRPLLRSSDFDLSPDLHGQSRVIAAVKAAGGTRYVNPSGGRELYDHASFAACGIELGFLAPYQGSYSSILTRLLEESPEAIASEIRSETVVAP